MIEIEGPVWDNVCRHEKDEYVGSFVMLDSESVEYKYDLYVYTDKLSGDSNGCLRYGNEGHEYLSPGCVVNMFHHPGLLVYQYAREMLREKGVFTWKLS